MPDTSFTATPPKPAPILRWIVAVAFFMQMLDGTILNTAIPGIASALAISPLRMQSAVIAYMLTVTLLIPASGWLADHFGARRVFIMAIVLFSFGSLMCAASASLEFLVFSRVVQGIGGALMVPVGRLAVIKAYPRHELVQVLSFITIPGLIGPLVGPMAGGFLVQYASWHWIFLINLPVGALGILLAFRYMPDIASAERERFDGLGFLLFGASMVLITLSMEGIGELRLPKIQVAIMCLSGLLLLALYWLRSARVAHPLFAPRIFHVRSFSVGLLGNLFARLGSGGMPFLLPLFLQLGLGYPPLSAGLILIPTALAGIVGKSIIARLTDAVGFRSFLMANTVAVGTLIASFSLVTPATGVAALLLQMGIYGVFNSMQFTAMNSVTLIDLDNANMGNGNSLLSVTMQVSITCGVALAAAILNGFNEAAGVARGSGIALAVFHYTFICTGMFTVAAALVFSQVPKNAGGAGRAR